MIFVAVVVAVVVGGDRLRLEHDGAFGLVDKAQFPEPEVDGVQERCRCGVLFLMVLVVVGVLLVLGVGGVQVGWEAAKNKGRKKEKIIYIYLDMNLDKFRVKQRILT